MTTSTRCDHCDTVIVGKPILVSTENSTKESFDFDSYQCFSKWSAERDK